MPRGAAQARVWTAGAAAVRAEALGRAAAAADTAVQVQGAVSPEAVDIAARRTDVVVPAAADTAVLERGAVAPEAADTAARALGAVATGTAGSGVVPGVAVSSQDSTAAVEPGIPAVPDAFRMAADCRDSQALGVAAVDYRTASGEPGFVALAPDLQAPAVDLTATPVARPQDQFPLRAPYRSRPESALREIHDFRLRNSDSSFPDAQPGRHERPLLAAPHLQGLALHDVLGLTDELLRRFADVHDSR